MSDTRGAVPNHKVIVGGLFVIGVAFIILGYGQWGTAEVDYTLIYTGVPLTFIALAYMVFQGFRYRSPQFVGDNMHDSFAGWDSIEEQGDLRIIYLGGIKLTRGIHIKHPFKGTAITHKHSLTKIGENAASTARFNKRQIKQVNPGLWNVLDDLGIKPPVYIGYITKDQVDNQPDEEKIEELEMDNNLESKSMGYVMERLAETNEIANERRETIKELQSDLAQMKDFNETMSGGGGLFSRLKSVFG